MSLSGGLYVPAILQYRLILSPYSHVACVYDTLVSYIADTESSRVSAAEVVVYVLPIEREITALNGRIRGNYQKKKLMNVSEFKMCYLTIMSWLLYKYNNEVVQIFGYSFNLLSRSIILML